MELNLREKLAKDILKSSISYTILGFLPLSFAFIFTPVYLNYLSEIEYGILNLFMLYTGLIAQIYSLGVASAFGYFYWDVYKSKEKLKELISSILGILLLFQLLFIGIGLIFGEFVVEVIVKSSDQFTYNPIFITALFFSAFMVYYEMFLYFFRNEGKLKHYSILSISTLIMLTLGTLTGVVFLEMKEIGAIYGRTFGYGIVVTIFLSYFIYRYGISLNIKKSKAILLFSFPLFINTIIGALCYGIDRILIERLDTLENLGIYGFALIIISVIETWYNALNNALSPTLYKFTKESTTGKTKEIQGLSHAIILLVILVITIILAFLYPIFDLLIPESFHKAADYIPILAFGFIWRVFTTFSTYSLYIEKRTKYLIFNQSTNLILTILFGYFAYKYWGIMGIVFILYLVKIIEYVIMNYISKKIKKLPFKLNRFILLSIIMGASGFIIVYLNSPTINKYLLYCLPLVVFFACIPILLREEFKNILFALKHRKELF